MSDILKVIALLKDTITTSVYTGEIPESQTEPSLLVKDLSIGYDRTVSGRKVRKNSVWRITVVAKTASDVELLLTKLESIDNSRNGDFQKIFTNLVMTEYGQNEQPFRRAFYDLIVY